MSLLFDRFPDYSAARRFADDVAARWKRDVAVYTSQEESDSHDPFPFELHPPIVHVSRANEWDKPGEQLIERDIEEAVTTYGGSFAGT